MRAEAEPGQMQWLARIEALARARQGDVPGEVLAAFVRAYYQTTSVAMLELRSPEVLLDVAIRHLELARQRKPGIAKLRVLPPDARGLAALQTVTDDMPFLVDSISMAIRERGVQIDWLVHPITHVARDASGAWDELADDGETESLIHIEFEALADPAQYAALEQAVLAVLADIRCVVDDFSAMRTRAVALAGQLAVPDVTQADERGEAAAFLHWLDDGHFTFLGLSETDAVDDGEGGGGFIVRAEDSLGLARPGRRYSDADALIAPREELDKYRESARLVVITKGNARATIHHAEFIDVVSIKRLRADGSVAGTCRFIGLFAADAYIERLPDIPVLRRKAAAVMARAQLPAGSHAEKFLRETLYQLPRDELFQSSEDELYATCMGVRALRERSQLRLFMRRDRYGRFFSCLVYLPRERYSRELRDRIGACLLERCAGTALDRNVDFLRRGMARLHYIVRTPAGSELRDSVAQIEQALIAATRTWRDEVRDALVGAEPALASAASAWLDAFPIAYQETTPIAEVLLDLDALRKLSEESPMQPRLMLDLDAAGPACPTTLTLYSRKQPLPLSDVLPAIENFGLRVLAQDLHELRRGDALPCFLQRFRIAVSGECPLPPAQQRRIFEEAFSQTWRGEVENDGLHRLVLRAGLDARQVVCLRVLTRYLIQTGLPFSQDYQERLLAEYAPIARLLVQLFEARFDPQLDAAQRRQREIGHAQALDEALDQVQTLDGDRVLRAYAAVVRAALRSNYFQRGADGRLKDWVSLKLDSRRVPELPAPLPMVEVFVYATRFEGIHLRGGLVARGGLRWSDRPQDFRTEILGLMKAQKVKNAIIVPVGAKGGFVLKQVDPSDRERWMREGIACYQNFLRGLLDLTDNRVGDAVQPPPALVRHDGDDPYLVVAADKGTAAFSDIANAVAAEYGFWLGDAFASGGSAGYDHKKMGITARGAWKSVQRHFRELRWLDAAGAAHDGKDIQTTPFSVVGIGDMSGDVFGNGMLLSPQIRLVAAFDHRHVFLDPDPDPAVSFAERERLFGLPRSSWDDYDRTRISAGGGVWPRSAKLIVISDAAQRVLGTTQSRFSPQELIATILRAPVDLLWNGGIGTYVKSRHQAHDDCGDRANDAVRVDGRELRCKVVGEGGNLGFTQLGRVEYALEGAGGAGGRINTDFIDNAGGVHTSDREVNIKIPLNRLLRDGSLDRAQRDPLLGACTAVIADAVLRDNAVQSLALSLLERDAVSQIGEHDELLRMLERDGQLQRAVEFLPDDEALKERRAKNRGLTRPELAVLLSYSKLSLFDAVLHSTLPDDPALRSALLEYFPQPLVAAYPDAFEQHQLRREILSTILANAVVNRMGCAFTHRFADDHGVARADVVKAYVIAHRIFDGDRYWLPIESLDGQLASAVQLRLFGRAIGLLRHATSWVLNNGVARLPLEVAITRYAAGIAALSERLPAMLSPHYRKAWDQAQAAMLAEGVPAALAQQLANTLVLGSAPDIIEIAAAAGVPLDEAAEVYLLIGDRLGMLWLLSTIIATPAPGKWQALARSNLREDAYRLLRNISTRVLRHPGASAAQRVDAWSSANADALRFAIARLQELQLLPAQHFTTLAVAVRELRKLSRL